MLGHTLKSRRLSTNYREQSSRMKYSRLIKRKEEKYRKRVQCNRNFVILCPAKNSWREMSSGRCEYTMFWHLLTIGVNNNAMKGQKRQCVKKCVNGKVLDAAYCWAANDANYEWFLGLLAERQRENKKMIALTTGAGFRGTESEQSISLAFML